MTATVNYSDCGTLKEMKLNVRLIFEIILL
jgi:hypothetical protein